MKLKIFNFGLPRTGTTSFHFFMKKLGFKSLHSGNGVINDIFPSNYFNFVKNQNDPRNILNKLIYRNEVFSDLPWYSNALMNVLIKKYENDPNVKFVATIRNKESWLNSIKKLNSPNWINGAGSVEFHKYEYNGIFDKYSEFCETELNQLLGDYYNKHYELLKELCADYLLLNIDNINELKSNITMLLPEKESDINNIEYPHKGAHITSFS